MSVPEPVKLEVGKLYSDRRTTWEERADFNWRNGAFELRIFMDRPTREEVWAIRKGRSEFALYQDGPALFLLYRFHPGVPWSDASYTVHLVPVEDRSRMPEVGSAQERWLLTVILVDARTGIIQALRQVTFPLELSHALTEAIREQERTPWDEAAYDAAIRSVYDRYPTTEALLRASGYQGIGGS